MEMRALNEKEKAIAVVHAFAIWVVERSPEEVVQVIYFDMDRPYLRRRAGDLDRDGPALFFNGLAIDRKERCIGVAWDSFGKESMRRVVVAKERMRKCKHTK